MKMLSMLAFTAAFAATGALAQSAAPDQGTVHRNASHHSTVRHPSQSRPRTEGRAYARAPGERSERGRAGAFDGPWSVLINTRSGACDPSLRYGIEISNGVVHNAGGAPIALSGRVAPSGAVQVSVSSGDQSAVGAGRLTRTSGSGTWRGQGSRGVCAGTWVAERYG
jgi:hypothetical protein